MKEPYIIGIDQSTQGTKVMLFDQRGRVLAREDRSHRQIIDANGQIGHDPEEIYRNLILAAGQLLKRSGIDGACVAAVGISNQRETVVAWDRESGVPVCHAIVWQCARGEEVCRRMRKDGREEAIRQRTGLPLSPYFSAAKLAWILEHVDGVYERARQGEICFGTMDSWLIYRLTGGKLFASDVSNAARTQLFHIGRLQWDETLCSWFGIPMACLPRVFHSDARFGETDLEGLLPGNVPIHGVMGDSNSALFGHGCLEKGTMKVTYGTGSSVMMHVGREPVYSPNGLAASVAWGYQGSISYVMEGNINYTGAVVTWMKENLGLIQTSAETEALARQADPTDATYLIPAFSGLGAPYWKSTVSAAFLGMSRRTGRKELVKAGLESIAYQIADVVFLMEQESGIKPRKIFADGGPAKNSWLMQFQSSILDRELILCKREELSCIGAAYLAGISAGIYCPNRLFETQADRVYVPSADRETFRKKYAGWVGHVNWLVSEHTG